jgi:hypothetical protein
MSLTNRISIVLSCSTLLWMTGCVGPMACGPTGGYGPIAFNSCDGCGDCEGCGELYIDPWINEPADCCDPCDRCGNYNGQSCGKCRSVFAGFASLWGYRCDPACDSCDVSGCDGGCDAVGCDPGCGCESCAPIADCGPGCGCESCAPIADCGPGCGCESCASIDGNGVIPIAGEPTPAKEITKARPAPEPYKPRRKRQIFRPRSNIAEGKAITITR